MYGVIVQNQSGKWKCFATGSTRKVKSVEVWNENETEKAEENNGKRENKTNGEANSEDKTAREGIYED